MAQKEILFKDGDTYLGQIGSQGKMDGTGTYTFKNKSYYKGSFRDGQFHGRGELVDRTNNMKIVGQFVNGKAHCEKGSIEYTDGSSYKGSIKNNMREGEGVYVFSQSSECTSYEGNFQRDKFDGIGLLRFKNGGQYKGFFNDGVYHGMGELKQPQFTYKGYFSCGRIEGEGQIAYKNGQTYKGSFKYNKRNGKGTCQYPTGQTYEGDWKNDQKHGKGKLKISEQESFQGDFEDDEISGMGIYRKGSVTIDGNFDRSQLNGEAELTDMKTDSHLNGIFRNGIKNGFFTLQRNIKGEIVSFRGEFKDGKEHPHKKTISSRI